jgi:hypothetical protein
MPIVSQQGDEEIQIAKMTLQPRITAHLDVQEDSYLLKTVLPNVAESLFRGCVVLFAPFRLGQKARIIFHNTEAIVSEFVG